jgi:hypothetical protein
LYKKDGKIAEASELSDRIKAAMTERSDHASTGISSAPDTARSSEDVFKNIQVLKGVPSDQLVPAMQFMASSLGVECSFCHVEGHFEKDEKKPKQTARKMMQMTFALNSDSFSGKRVVTCYSCHRGSPDPIGTPLLASESQKKNRADGSVPQELPTNLPTVSQLLDRYIEALGGSNAIQNISSRVQKGSINISGQSLRVEVFIVSRQRWAFVRHLPEGDSIAAFNGQAGWFTFPLRPPRDMHPAEIEAARMDADLQFPLHIQSFFPELRVEYPENVGDRESDVLLAANQGHPVVKLYFDKPSGLLVRVVRYGDSPLGLNPSRVDYADYREIDGVQVPFRITTSQPESSSTIQFDEVRQNAQIGAAVFARPPAAP